MLELRRGNLLEADAEALVNTVNCVGVMGKGIALQFKQAFPENFQQYQKACRASVVQPGKMFIVPTGVVNPKYIINFPTKRHWKGRARIEDVRAGLVALIDDLRHLRVTSVAVPPLGCGNGGLDWSEVRPMIEEAFAELSDVKVFLFEPAGAPAADTLKVNTKAPAMTRARALLVALIRNYGAVGYRLTRLEIQKLLYFLQEAGEPLGLKFVKHRYGPYAEAVNHMMVRIDGHFIRGYGDRTGDAGIYPLPQAVQQAIAHIADDLDAARNLVRVSRLIAGFETPYGMELLASVHWVCSENPDAARDADLAIQKVHVWSQRKRLRFRDDHIRKAWQRLRAEGWIGTPESIAKRA